MGEENGNPLQYSCLENPRDRGAWWAAVYRVAQSQTRLKQLSSSSSLMGANCVHLLLSQSHAGSLKLTRVGAFTPQKSANTTNQHYFSQKGGCLVCTSTPWLQTADNWAFPIEEGNGEQGLYLSEGHKYWKTSLCCVCYWLDSYTFTYCTKAVTIIDTSAAL